MKKQKVPGIVTLAILTVITAIFWVVLDVYRVLTTKPDPVVPEEILNPLDPTLDQGSIDLLQEKLFLQDSELGNISIQATPQPTPKPSPPVEATGEAQTE